MRNGIFRLLLTPALLVGALASVGCMSSGKGDMKSDMSMMADPKYADMQVVTTGTNGTTVTSYRNGTLMTSASPGATMCSACQDDIKNYYKTGMIDPVCKACGAKRTVVMMAPMPMHGHN